MSTFAKIDENNIVVEVIVADQDFIDSGAVGPKESWVECCINNTIRGRYPGIGHSYNVELDEFLPQKPADYPSWVWNGKHGFEGAWTPPIPFTGNAVNGKAYDWDESSLSWKEVTDTDLNQESIMVNLVLPNGTNIIKLNNV
jgi:hypothetical protein